MFQSMGLSTLLETVCIRECYKPKSERKVSWTPQYQYKKTGRHESIIAFGQGKPIWKHMQEVKWFISLLRFSNTSRLCTAYKKSTVGLNASSTTVPSLWCRKRSQTTSNDKLCKETCANINHH